MKLSFSWDPAIFKSRESFSPFLLISSDPTRWGEVLLEGLRYGPIKPNCPVSCVWEHPVGCPFDFLTDN